MSKRLRTSQKRNSRNTELTRMRRRKTGAQNSQKRSIRNTELTGMRVVLAGKRERERES
jgi:hypothetical protein